MPRLTFISKNKKNKGIVFNDKEILSLYFYGVGIANKQGTSFTPEFLEFYIRAAQEEIEKYLGIKIVRQLISERSDYFKNEFAFNGFIKTKYPVGISLSLNGMLGDQAIVRYPKHWLTNNSTGENPTVRQIVMVPNSNVSESSLQSAVFGVNVLNTMGINVRDQIGSYWDIKYITGFKKTPFDLMNVIGKLAAIGLFNILGDIALGTAGLASYSVSIDGLSQSVGTTNSATNAAFGARILNYQKEIKESLQNLEKHYKGIIFSAV